MLYIVGATVAWSSAGLIARLVDDAAGNHAVLAVGFALLFILCQIARYPVRGGMRGSRFAIGVAGVAMAPRSPPRWRRSSMRWSTCAVANVLVFQAASPFFAALLAWLWIGERPRAADFACGLRVAARRGDHGRRRVGPNDLIGDALSAVMALSFALTIVLARARSDMPMGAVTALAMLMMAA